MFAVSSKRWINVFKTLCGSALCWCRSLLFRSISVWYDKYVECLGKFHQFMAVLVGFVTFTDRTIILSRQPVRKAGHN